MLKRRFIRRYFDGGFVGGKPQRSYLVELGIGVDVQRLCPPKWSGKMSI